ncbi:MAG: hypothetical protein HY897_12160 [Deltaproteobacteria bacterium]|nr:hypothetical protein [Deltaproteobacteria bacterium]
MKASYHVACTVAALMFSPAPVRAEGEQTCTLYPRPKAAAKAGDWVEYRMTGKVPATMRMAVTGVEGTGENALYWLEVSMSDAFQKGVVKSLLVGDPLTPKKVKRIIMKTGSTPAMEIPPSMIAKIDLAKNPLQAQGPCAANPGSGVAVPTEEKAVIAGKTVGVRVSRVERDGKKLVFKHSDGVPLTGLVFADFGAQKVELTGFGHDAKTQITEEPVPLEQAMPGITDLPPPAAPATR